MHIFKKVPPVVRKLSSGNFHAYELQSLTKTVEENGVQITRVVFERVPLFLKTERADIPAPEDYELRELLKQGYVPKEVNVKNLLDNFNELDTQALNLVETVSEPIKENNVEPNE